MAPHSNTLAWKIPWMEEPGRLHSMGSLGVGESQVTSLSLFTFKRWRRKWKPTPVFQPGESQGRECLVGCHLWGRTESDTTEATQQQQQQDLTSQKHEVEAMNIYLSLVVWSFTYLKQKVRVTQSKENQTKRNFMSCSSLRKCQEG